MKRSVLRKARERAGLSQFALAVKAQTVTNSIARIERGDGLPSWECGLRIAETLGAHTIEEIRALFATDGES
jgi:DNA-binding XRE family transcriptional regulator